MLSVNWGTWCSLVTGARETTHLPRAHKQHTKRLLYETQVFWEHEACAAVTMGRAAATGGGGGNMSEEAVDTLRMEAAPVGHSGC